MTRLPPPSSYEEIPYPSVPFAQSHPDRLATLATLFGMDPPPPTVERCRVLELGCAEGDNLIPLALGLPDASFIGIDLSSRQITAARAAIEELGVRNIEFRRMDVVDFPDEMGQFDYIIAHGIYSWVPVEVRDRILDICRKHLRSNGVAYVSYNTLPGWRAGSVVRDALVYRCRRIQEPRERTRTAAAFLEFLDKAIPEQTGPYRTAFADAHRRANRWIDPGSFLFHEYLEDVNEPVYFHEFAAHAARHNLKYLADAEYCDSRTDHFPASVLEEVHQLSEDLVEREQYLDFLKGTNFRRSLLCHQDVSVQSDPTPEHLRGLHVSSGITCDEPEDELRSSAFLKFRDREGVEGATDHPVTKAALLLLSRQWPEAVPFETLQAAARDRLVPGRTVVMPAAEYERDTKTLAENLLKLYGAGLVELHVHLPRFMTTACERPVASPWARRQAAAGAHVTNLRHDGIVLSDVNRRLLCLMDGSRNRDQLVEALLRHVTSDGLVVLDEGAPVREPSRIRQVLEKRLDENLRLIARSALLIP